MLIYLFIYLFNYLFIYVGLRPHLLSTSSLSLKTTDSDTASLVSDAISISSFHSEVNNTNPTYCKVLYCYQVSVI